MAVPAVPSPPMDPVERQLEHILRTVDRVVPEGELAARIGQGEPLRVKLGVDPTAPDVHLGWAVVLDLLRRFQEMGHIAVLIVGDFTGQVGDPSDRSVTRKRLSAREVDGYAASCLEMLRPLLLEDRLEIRRNSEWLGAMDMAAVLDVTAQVTVSRILEREDFARRLDRNEPVSMLELMYPLLQGMDSVAVHADVEIGGTDQLWNLLVGRDLQARHGQEPQIAMTVPLLLGTDGSRKMSQSLGNYISVRDDPADMFGKTMSIPDALIVEYFRLTTSLSLGEIAAIQAGLAAGDTHPGEAKRRLGRSIVDRFWGEEAAADAEAAFDRVFREHRAPTDVEEVDFTAAGDVWLPGLLKELGLVASSSEGRRMVTQGAVRVDGAKVAGENMTAAALAGSILQVGKRRFIRLVGSE